MVGYGLQNGSQSVNVAGSVVMYMGMTIPTDDSEMATGDLYSIPLDERSWLSLSSIRFLYRQILPCPDWR